MKIQLHAHGYHLLSFKFTVLGDFLWKKSKNICCLSSSGKICTFWKQIKNRIWLKLKPLVSIRWTYKSHSHLGAGQRKSVVSKAPCSFYPEGKHLALSSVSFYLPLSVGTTQLSLRSDERALVSWQRMWANESVKLWFSRVENSHLVSRNCNQIWLSF